MLTSILTGCTTYTKVKTAEITAFRKELLAENNAFKSLKVQMMPAEIQFIYELKPKTTEQDAKEIFLKTKELILSKGFQDSAIEETFFKKYFDGYQSWYYQKEGGPQPELVK